jgi:hypothetical protein
MLAANDWEGVRKLDSALAKIRPGALLFASATRARVQWRVSLGDPSEGPAAIAIIDVLLTRQRSPNHYLLRASAGLLAQDQKLGWAALEEAVRGNRLPEQLRQVAVNVARRLGRPPEGSKLLQLMSPTVPDQPGVEPRSEARPAYRGDSRVPKSVGRED